MTADARRAALEAIAEEVRVCQRCRLAAGRRHAVPGEGHPDTEVVFVGEGPGQREDEQGRPFVGPAGAFLEELLSLVEWRREDVFITNVVKCRPPGNRDPEPDEMAACRPYLERQLAVLDPALVVTLGRFSLQAFMPGARISQAHGTERPVDPRTGAQQARAYAMYHPAAALRQQALRETMMRDMAAIPEALLRARAARESPPTEAPEMREAAPEAPAPPAANEVETPSVGSLPAPTAVPGMAAREERPDDQLGLF